MSCTVAIPSSPAFSPAPRVPVRSSSFSSSSSCKSSETLTLTRFPSFTSSSSSSPSSRTTTKTTTTYPVYSHRWSLGRAECTQALTIPRTDREVVSERPSASSSSPSLQLKVLPISLIRNSTHCSTSAPTSSSSSTTVLKRKRPARLDIPVVVSKTLENFRVNQVVMMDDVDDEGEGYYVCCKRGRRGAMEDRYSALVNLQGHSKQGMFGIFDGHGGAKAAEFAAEHLNKNVMNELVKRNDEDVAESVRMGYLKTDSEFLSQDFRGGSCCVTALIRNSNLVVSNAGDCRAVVSRGGIAEALTSDHKPSRKDEKDRIETSGGYVDCSNGVWRIQGSLAVSRGIGDRYLKQWIIAEPETKVFELNPELEFLVLASDGLWDKVSNQEVVDAARPFCAGINKPQPLLASKKLIDLAFSRGSVDDISVMIIQLQQFC